MKKNWRTRIAEARERGTPTEADLVDARSWPTCVCGEQDERIKRGLNGAPDDPLLNNRGLSFSIAISLYHWDHAEKLLDDIEVRTAEIIAEAEECQGE